MNKSKTFSYEYDEYEDGTKGAHTLIDDLLADPDFSGLTELSRSARYPGSFRATMEAYGRRFRS